MNEEKKNEFTEEYRLVTDTSVQSTAGGADTSNTVASDALSVNAPCGAPDTSAHDLKRARRTYSRIGLSLVAYVLVTYLVTYVCIFIMAAIDKRMLSTGIYYWVVSIIPPYVCALPVLWLMISGLPKAKIEKKKLSIPMLLFFFLLSFGMLSIGNNIGNTVMEFIHNLTGANFAPVVEDMLSKVSLWFNIIVVAILGPIVEELIFRKLLIDRLAVYGERSAILISAALFGLLHGNFSQLFYAVLIGIILGYVYCRTGKVRYTIAIHMAINAISGVFTSWLSSNLDLEKLSSIVDQEELMDFIAENAPYLLALLGYMIAYYGAMIAAVILIIVFFKRAWATFDRELIPKGQRLRTMMLNVGMLLACTVFVAEFVLNIVSYNL